VAVTYPVNLKATILQSQLKDTILHLSLANPVKKQPPRGKIDGFAKTAQPPLAGTITH
jgi:hypothetical protein